MKLRAAAATWAAACSLVFIVVYQACNRITAQRSDVGTWYFEWELGIPFVPVMIVPYWSIDLLFVGSFFLCSTRRELDVHAKRILLAIAIAAACFLLFPLRLAFPRPAVGGVLGALFDLLRGFDQPFNLFPSLHIAFRTLLARVYVRHTRGALRWGTRVWFSLIGFSTVLTWQHHVVDVAGGFVLAWLCFYVLRESQRPLPVIPNRRIAAYYGGGATLAAALSFATWPCGGGALLWPAFALAVVASAYVGIGPRIYRKEDGRLAASARVLLAPCLLGQWLSLAWYSRRSRRWDEVVPGLWLGRQLTRDEAAEAVRGGVVAVLDATVEFSAPAPFRDVVYQNSQILDLTAPTPGQLRAAVAFIGEHLGRGAVYVHCKAGYSRSAALVGAYLLMAGHAHTVEEALSKMRQARPRLVVRPEAVRALEGFHASETRR